MKKALLASILIPMKQNIRKCGILIHPTSFNSPFGIGDLGAEARSALSTLAKAKISLWQILPLGPTGFGDSPYSCRSCFAGNELLIDLRQLGYDEEITSDRTARIDYPSVYANKMVILKQIAKQFIEENPKDKDYLTFCKENSWWLDDYALYQALVNHFNDSRWFLWPEGLKFRKKSILAQYKKDLASDIDVYKVLQFFFFKQWNDLHKFANDLGIKIIGDIPIFAAGDSVDVWTNPKLFKLDKNLMQTALAGCPPDAFSPTGQLWGNPVYDWKEHEKDDYAWWRRRMEMTLKMVDIVRIDHFRGFESYWEVPAGEETAINGTWQPGPGMNLLKHFKKMDIIAEDLGVITKEVDALLKKSKFPGMKVIQFGWNLNENGSLITDHKYLPHNYPANSVAYTGTHDNQTTRGWFDSLSENYKDYIRRYMQCPNEDVVWQMMRSLLQSQAKYVIFPMQDVMGLDDNARMNMPSTVGSANWSWRMNPEGLKPWMIDRLKEFIMLYGRC